MYPLFMDEIISKIVESLDFNLKEKGSYAQFNDSSYKPIKIDNNNFHEINGMVSNKKIMFIDGGNAEILKASNFSLQLMRIYYSIYQQNKKIASKKHEFYVLVNALNKDEEIVYKTEFFGLNKEKIEFNSFDETIRQGRHRISISNIGNVIRRFIELETATKLIDELGDGDIILMDGDLKASITNEADYFSELYGKALDKKVVVSALSKTNELFTEKGNALIPVLKELEPNSIPWYYFPLVEISNNSHQVDIYIVKLNRNSKYVFKFEVFNKMSYEINELLAVLRNNSSDPVFLGYPYGLIEADKFARVANSERDYLKTLFLTKLGKNSEKIANYLNAINAHNMLDSMAYRQ